MLAPCWRNNPSYKCSKNEESIKFPARSIRIFEKIFTRGGEIAILVEGGMNTEGISVGSYSKQDQNQATGAFPSIFSTFLSAACAFHFYAF